MHIRNLTICFEIYSLQPWGSIAVVKICHLPMSYFPYTTLCLSLVGMDSCGLLPARIYQSISITQLVGGWLYPACLESHGQYSDLQENKRLAEYSQAFWASKSQSHTLQVRWLDILSAMKDEVILHVCTQPVTAILPFKFIIFNIF